MSIPGSSHSSMVWSKALEIANINLPPLDLTLQSAEENINIEAIIKALSTLQKDAKKKGWWYPWHRKDSCGAVEKYSKAVDTPVQSNPQISAFFWASVWTILQVCIYIEYCVDIPKLY